MIAIQLATDLTKTTDWCSFSGNKLDKLKVETQENLVSLSENFRKELK